MSLRQRGYLIEHVEPFPRWVSGPVSSPRQLKDKFKGDPGMLHMLKVLGLDPDNPPKEEQKKTCPECGCQEVVIRERHPDTEMNYMERRCLVCNYREEV